MSTKKIYVAGHKGMVGSAICRQLSNKKDIELITANKENLDLISQTSVEDFLREKNPDIVIIAAAKVGGINSNNTYPAQFIYENLQIQNNLIHFSHASNIQKLLFLGSSCIYPKFAKQPMSEDALLSGKLESTNEPYAIAKIAGIKMCESYNRQYQRDYRSIMPTNLYGPGDNFHPMNSHVLPALLKRFHEAKKSKDKKVKVWGTGLPKREFLHVDDMASASIFVMNLSKSEYEKKISPMCSHINIGSGQDVSIIDLAKMIKEVVGFKGKIIFDTSKPDGSPQKLMDISILKNLGWRENFDLLRGIKDTYTWFLENENNLRSV